MRTHIEKGFEEKKKSMDLSSDYDIMRTRNVAGISTFRTLQTNGQTNMKEISRYIKVCIGSKSLNSRLKDGLSQGSEITLENDLKKINNYCKVRPYATYSTTSFKNF